MKTIEQSVKWVYGIEKQLVKEELESFKVSTV